MTGFDCRRDGLPHTDPHDTPGAHVQSFARLVHINNAAGEIKCVGAFIDENSVWPVLNDLTQYTKRPVVIHRYVIVLQFRHHAGDVGFFFRRNRAHPLGRRCVPVIAKAIKQCFNTRPDITDNRRRDFDVAVHFLRLDVDLHKLSRLVPPGLSLAVREQPIEAGADHHNRIGFFQHQRPCRAGRKGMRVGQQTFGHAHCQIGNAAFFDEGADLVVGLRICSAFAEDDERALCLFQNVQCALHGFRRGQLARCRVNNFDQGFGAGLGIHGLTQEFRRQIKIDTTRPAGNSRTNGARNADTDIFRVQDAVSGLTERLGNGQLVHLFIVALLQVDNFALRRAADQDHWKAIGRCVCQCR